MKTKMKFLLLISVVFAVNIYAQPFAANWQSLDTRKIPDWFHQDKFGIFIHWGVYAVPSFSRVVPDGYSEWYWCNYNDSTRQNHTAVKEFHNSVYGADFTYQQFAPMFKAELFEPNEWANIFKKSGARYVVLTSKHHDGFALWPSAEANASWGRPWNALSVGPKRDVLGDLTTAVRKAGLKMGFYYSLMEWYNPVFKKSKSAYVNEVMIPQFKDLVTRYKPSLIFSDGEWIMDEADWKSTDILAWLYNESPVAKEVVVNDRWGKTTRKKHPSTYYTSEYGSGMDRFVIWEENRGMGQSYGYNRMEKLSDYKSANELILMLADIVAKGGNLLLDIGPAADGVIPVIMEERLVQIGDWLKINGEAIFETHPWIKDKQWSEGTRPIFKDGNYQTNYDIAQLVKTTTTNAFVELFFTIKGGTVYAISPSYSKKIRIKNCKPGKDTKVSILGLPKNIPWQVEEKDIILDMSGLLPNELSNSIFTIKITHVLQN